MPNKNDNDKFINQLSKKFFKQEEKDQGDTPDVVVNDFINEFNKYHDKIQDVAVLFIEKDGTNYFRESKTSVASVIGLLKFFLTRATTDFTNPKPSGDDDDE